MAKFIRRIAVWWFRKSGWSFSGQIADFQPKTIVLAGPNLGILNFFVAIAVLTMTGVRSTLLVHSKYFNVAFGTILRRLSCRPYNPNNTDEETQNLSNLFKSRKKLTLIFDNADRREGTSVSQPVFYAIADELHLPIVLVTIDKKKKHVRIYSEFMPSGNRARDLGYCKKVFASLN